MVKVIEQVSAGLQKLGPTINYGEPVSVGGAEIVPVSAVWMGFGGGQDAGGDEASGGGGGGGASIPLGAYVPGFDGPEFKPNLIVFMVASAVVISSVGSAIGAIIGASRGKRGLFG